MINHITLLVSDIKKSQEFFRRALGPLGYRILADYSDTVGLGQTDQEGSRDLWIKRGEVSSIKTISCLAFTAQSKHEVDDFYSQAMAAGGRDNGKPGYRPQYHAGYYAAFVYDPDGNNIEAVWDDFTQQ